MMTTDETRYFDQYEDSYSAAEFPTFAALMRKFEALCEDALYSRWNVPVWIDADDPADLEEGDQRRVRLGLMLTRHGVTTQWVAPLNNDAELHELRSRMLRVWAGRADIGFMRHPPLPELPA